jgi:hypothetical protein
MPAPSRGWKPPSTTTPGPSSRRRKTMMGPKPPGGQAAAPVAAVDTHPERRSGHTRSANPCQPTPMPGPSRGSTTMTTNPAKQPDGAAAAPVTDACMPPKRTPRHASSPARRPDEEGGDFEHRGSLSVSGRDTLEGGVMSGELPLTHLPFYSLLSSISIHYSLFSFATYLLVVLVLTVTIMVTVT